MRVPLASLASLATRLAPSLRNLSFSRPIPSALRLHQLHLFNTRHLSSRPSSKRLDLVSLTDPARNRSYSSSNDSGRDRKPRMGYLWGITHVAAAVAIYVAVDELRKDPANAFIAMKGFLDSGADKGPKDQAKEEELKVPTLPTTTQFPSNPPIVVFVLGGPGAGKGTQCVNLVRDHGFVHLSAGDLLRAEQTRPGSAYGGLIDHYIREGLIVPMEITVSLLLRAMQQARDTKGATRFLVDGFPRKQDQADAFERVACEARAVLYFECPEVELERRLVERGRSSGRADDNLESIRKRFATFKTTSYPVIAHYDHLGKVVKVSCLGTPEAVYAATERGLAERGIITVAKREVKDRKVVDEKAPAQAPLVVRGVLLPAAAVGLWGAAWWMAGK